mmetsp:Transcript_2773/g.12540  ORF Transcript_2773/g.12540 Transcript_2773/m.12540 type:complete len:255 (+) Transcript_2773:1032-1796(+)
MTPSRMPWRCWGGTRRPARSSSRWRSTSVCSTLSASERPRPRVRVWSTAATDRRIQTRRLRRNLRVSERSARGWRGRRPGWWPRRWAVPWRTLTTTAASSRFDSILVLINRNPMLITILRVIRSSTRSIRPLERGEARLHLRVHLVRVLAGRLRRRLLLHHLRLNLLGDWRVPPDGAAVLAVAAGARDAPGLHVGRELLLRRPGRHRYSADGRRAEVGVAFLYGEERAQVLVPGLAPLGDEMLVRHLLPAQVIV